MLLFRQNQFCVCLCMCILCMYSTHFGYITKSQKEIAVLFWFIFLFGSFDYIVFSLCSNTKLDNSTLLLIICNPISLFSIYHRVLASLSWWEKLYKKCREMDSFIATNFPVEQFLMLRELNTKPEMKVACTDSSANLRAVCYLLQGKTSELLTLAPSPSVVHPYLMTLQ